MSGPVLVCAASRVEARACERGIADAGLASSFEILETGVGLENAREALTERLVRGSRPGPRLVVSSGFAGAFSAELPLHGWVTADEVVLIRDGAARTRFTVQPVTSSQASPHVCRLATSADLVVGHETLAQGYGTLAAPVAVDMETAALAHVCKEARVPIRVFRLITDTPGDPLPDFLHPIAAAMAERDFTSRVKLGLQGVRGALRDLSGAARLARESTEWARLLRSGWRQNAESLRKCGEEVDLLVQ